MKYAIFTMIGMFILMVPMGGLWGIVFKPIIGGGIEQSFLYPLYIGIILLAGIIVGCTKLVIDEIRSTKKNK